MTEWRTAKSETAEALETLRSPLVMLVVIMFLAMFAFTVGAIYQHYHQIPSGGDVHSINVEVFKDESLTLKLRHIDWGEIWINETQSVNVTCYVKNIGHDNATLTVFVNNTQPPSFSDYMTFTALYSDETLVKNQVISMIFVLTIDAEIPNTIDDFSFDIWLIAEQT